MSEPDRESTAGRPAAAGDLPDLDGASVLVRVDFNVPLRPCEGEPAVVTDDFRIRAALPTLEYLLAQGATVTACTHLGRPEGAPDARCDLGPVREELARLAPQVELLENLRFDPGETANDPAFVEKLDQLPRRLRQRRLRRLPPAPRLGGRATEPAAQCGRAASCSRRSRRSAGCSARPARPFVAVVGGAKVADKLGRAQGPAAPGGRPGGGRRHGLHLPGRSRSRRRRLPGRPRTGSTTARLCWPRASPILLPTDIVALEPGAAFGCDCTSGEVRMVGADIPDGWQGLDIGPATVAAYAGRHRRGRHRAVERTDGRLRGPAVRRRDRRGGPGHGRAATVSPWSAGATARRRSTSSDWTGRSVSSRPAGERRSNCSSTATCPASPRSAGHPTPPWRSQPPERIRPPVSDAALGRRR